MLIMLLYCIGSIGRDMNLSLFEQSHGGEKKVTKPLAIFPMKKIIEMIDTFFLFRSIQVRIQ